MNWNYYSRTSESIESNETEAFLSVLCKDGIFQQLDYSKITGIFLMTDFAGASESIALWENALQHSPAFANPRNFPWTLACCPTSYLARELKAKGPNITLFDNGFALQQILEMIDLYRENNLLENAIIAKLTYNDFLNCKLALGTFSNNQDVNNTFDKSFF